MQVISLRADHKSPPLDYFFDVAPPSPTVLPRAVSYRRTPPISLIEVSGKCLHHLLLVESWFLGPAF
ncbi:hypothetical protein NL676_017343 [Syzygium grande]|nr:hypothetical protein NL676_017343 [Syzygium grande]